MQWIAKQNIKNFEQLLAVEADPDKKARLEGLLQEEREKLASLIAEEARR